MTVKFVSRRAVLGGLAATATAPLLFHGAASAQPAEWLSLNNDPFRLGVASGDPDGTSVVIWTRLAPAPFQADGGLPARPIPVEWEIGLNDTMTRVMYRGRTLARPESGHAVHVLVEGLLPERTYWYRFRAGAAESPIGRTRTLSVAGAARERLRLAVASCQRIEHGHYTAWADIAAQDIDLVFHAGDYIYEYALPSDIMRRAGVFVPDEARQRVTTLDQYRMRYALYRIDRNLAAAHAAHPFVASFDDHEVVNNWAGDTGAKLAPDAFRASRAIAFQAFYEHMPVRAALAPQGPDMRAYRAIEAGDLLRLAALDTRQYRSPHPCGIADRMPCEERHRPDRQMLGAEQEAWLLDLMSRNDTAWTVLGNQVMMMQARYKDPTQDIVETDKWDGYAAARRRLLSGAAERKTRGLVVVTGDLHHAVAGNLKPDFDHPRSPVVGAEFITSSISSGGDGSAAKGTEKRLRADNPHIRFYDNRRGYVLCSFDRKRCETVFRAVAKVSEPGAAVSTIATFGIDAAKPGIA